MNFEEILDWLYSFEKFGMKLGLERINHIAKELGNPHLNYKVIHVGGTNGKGSVCKFLESILTRAGFKVGVYTSPHLQHISERITVNKKMIKEDELVNQVEKIKPIIEDMMKKGQTPTFFEVFTGIAFQFFADCKVDFAVIEVGLGGRFDATNIVTPEVSVITNISFEHQNVLGKTVEKIAFEKAGIIKKDVPVVTAAKEGALKVISKVAKENNSYIEIIKNSNWKRLDFDSLSQDFLIEGFLDSYKVRTSLMGKIQGENIALAIGAIEFLKNKKFEISNKAIIEGIKNTVNPGRVEVISYNPTIVLDGAHNIDSIKLLSDTIKNDFEFDRLILVIGILSDKDVKEMLDLIIPLSDFIVVTKSQNKRACSTVELRKIIEDLNLHKPIVVKETIENAINYCKSISKENDLICITGSLFTVGEARDFFLN